MEINIKVYVLGLAQNPSSQKKKMQMMHADAVHAQKVAHGNLEVTMATQFTHLSLAYENIECMLYSKHPEW